MMPCARWILLTALALVRLGHALRTELQKLNDLMDIGEVVHRAFTNRYDVQLGLVTSSEGRICASSTPVSLISRQFFENSWTTIESISGDVEAMFNAQQGCFMKYAGQCETYATCADATSVFDRTMVPREGLFWAGNHTKVMAWQLEQLALLDQLPSDLESELGQKLRGDLQSAAGFAEEALSQLRSLLQERLSDFTRFVDPATAPAPKGGAAALPASLLSLATDVSNLLAAAPTLANSNCGSGWLSGPAQDVASELDAQDAVFLLINVNDVMQLSQFDYLRRAVEALLSGAALALQVATFTALTEFNCLLQFSPQTALVSAVDAVQDAVNGVLVKLRTALPSPSLQDAATPLRRCLAERVQDAEDRLPEASSPLITTTVPLLPLDFCGRLFNVTARELLAVTPYAGDVPFTSPTELFAASGEQRHVRLDASKGLSLLGPFVCYVDRSSGDTNAFTVGDQVLQLQAIQEMTVRAARAMPEENQCSNEQKTQLNMEQSSQVCSYAGCSSSCEPGCYRRFSCDAGVCSMAIPSLWADGETEQVCDPVEGNYYFYAFKWPNSSCAFLCQEADQRPVGRSCQGEVGYWSPVCNNSYHECDVPEGITASQFSAVANFTTAGRGAADGCEITAAFVAAKPPAESFAVASLIPPFTVETFVNISLDAIPTGATSVSSLAVLFGSFPSWYLALRHASAGQAQLVFYHSRVTLASHISAEDSTIASSSFSWDNSREPWRHVAVTVTQNVASRHNIFFYVDGVFISSGYRSVAVSDILEAPFVDPQHRDVFHVGPVNLKRFPAMLSSGRPYYDLPMYTAQLDEVRVHQEALDTLTLGAQITELRRLAACNTPYEQRDGSACHARPRLTPPNTTLEQTLCLAGYELCNSLPGICVESCGGNLLRQEDCSCDCPPSYFQTWLVSAIHLTGSGTIKNATVYDASHQILGQLGTVTLPRRIALAEASQVAVVSIWGGSSASSVSLEVETPAPESLRLVVPGLRNVALQADRPSLLHHQAVTAYADPTLSCAQCPGEAPRSVLPRTDTMSCRCAEGYGADLLGKCVPAAGPLQAPVIDLANGTYHTAGTRVGMSYPPQDVEGPWLLAIRYEYGTFPDAPNCDTSPKYEEVGETPGLDIIRRQETVTLRAVLCHPLHQISLESVVVLLGNDHMNPPRCVASGNLSTSSTYALEVEVELLVDQQPDATIYYEIQGLSGQVTYAAPFTLTTQGVVVVTAWAEKLGFDSSSRTSCSYSIDGEARLTLSPIWPEPSPLLGYSSSDAAFLVARDLENFALVLDVPQVADTSSLQLESRLWHGALGVSSWSAVPSSRAVMLKVSENLEAPNKTTLLQIEWRLKEPGYVWTTPGYVRLLIVRSRSEVPSILAEATVAWQLGDHWTAGPKRDVALRQKHTVQLVQPNPSARVLFSVRAEIGQLEGSAGPLLTMNPSNFTSLTAGAMLEGFVSSVPGAGLQADDMPSACGGTALQVLAVEVPKLCDYLGPFEVLGGAVVTAYAIVAGDLESLPATFLVPKELEPSATDLTFQAFAEASGNVLSISAQLQVLPSAAIDFSFSVGQPDAERQSCVLATAYSYQGSNSSKGLAECAWLPYNGPRKLFLSNLLAEVDAIGDLTLNVTVLTTVRRPGYLWSYPLTKSFLWLRERTPLPKVLQILEPGAVAPKAMVWLQEGQVAECFFTLHYEPLELSDVPFPFLVEVPSVTASVGSLAEAFRPTAFRGALHTASAWRTDVDLCAWPQACELPMNGTLPAELIAVPAGYTRLCAWALWQGYLESAPACELMTSSPSVVAEPSFAPSATELQALPDSAAVLVPEEVGTDPTLRINLLRPRIEQTNTSARRLSSESMPLFLPRSHPLQYRWAVAAIDSSVLMQPGMTQSTLTASMTFSSWLDLGLGADTPLLPLPPRQLSDHVLFVVDVRLLTGVNRWSAETRTAALLMLGSEPAPSLVHVGRSVQVDGGRVNSSIYFKWMQGDIISSFGAELIQVQAAATSITNAFAVHPDAQLYDASDTSLCTVSDDSAVAQKQFCVAEAPLTLSIPSTGRWTLWTMAQSAGLQPSAATLVIGQMCPAPMDVAYARSSSSCVEGPLVESGTSCTATCEVGYSPSVTQLLCSDGLLTPPQFACAEDACAAPTNVSHAAESSCLEGENLAPGGTCTTQCAAGYTPSIDRLSCSRGRLSPSSFTCSEADCEAPEVIHGASPSCSGLPKVKSRENCSPQCQDGYVASQTSLQCIRGQLEPETFVCEPGVNVDVGIIIASVPSTLLAGSLALVAAYCFRGPKAVEEKEANDPLQEWWQCVQEVEPGICVFCGKEPEELETRYEDHGPTTLFRSCHRCAALLGFEVEEDDEELPSVEELKVDVDDGQESKDPTDSGGLNSEQPERNSLPRPAPLMELTSRSSRGSISDAVKGLQMENFLQVTENDVNEVPVAEEEAQSLAAERPPSPRERPETVIRVDESERLRHEAPPTRSDDSPDRSLAQGGTTPEAPSRRSKRERIERMSLADWQDSPDERSAEFRESPGHRRPDVSERPRRQPPRGTLREADRSRAEYSRYERDPDSIRQRLSTQENPSLSTGPSSTRGPSRRYEETRRSRRDVPQESRYQDSGGDDLRSTRSRMRSSRHRAGASNM